jgi:glucose-6-phosphate isomerase
MDTPIPMLAHIHLEHGQVEDPAEVITRRLSDMASHYQDAAAVQNLLKQDPVIYQVYMPNQPGELIGLYTATSVIEPGTIGDEFYMTKGHFHVDRNAPEIYLTLSGRGILLMQNHEGQIRMHQMQPGDLSFIPGEWAHRTINTGEAPLVFFATWPVEAGHDYESIEKSGFLRRVFKGEDGPEFSVGSFSEE